MRTKRALLIPPLILAISGAAWVLDRSVQPSSPALAPTGLRADRLPLVFEANLGQSDPRTRLLARGSGGTVSLTDRGAVFALGDPGDETAVALRMRLVGAFPSEVQPRRQQPGIVNHFSGSDPSRWITGIPTYAGARYPGVYPGIDMVFRGTGGELEYDFLLAPGADPSDIAFRVEGAEHVRLDDGGNLLVDTPAGTMVHEAPRIYQPSAGGRRPVSGSFSLTGGLVGFDLGAYDSTRPLVIDPVVMGFSTFLGGSGSEHGSSVAVDGAGATYVTGETLDTTTDLPTTTGSYAPSPAGGYDAFVTKLNPAGSALVYSTFLGGNLNDIGLDIAVDGSGAAYVSGSTAGGGFPTTPGAFDETHNGAGDAFAAKLSPTGATLVYSTLLGGAGDDAANALAVDAAGSAYLAGGTDDAAPDYPTTPGAVYETHTGSRDAFVTKLNSTGSALGYSTLLGGSDYDAAFGVAVDAGGTAFVTGSTDDGTTDYPVTPGSAVDSDHNGASDVFVTRLLASGSELIYSTLVGSTGDDDAYDLALDAGGNAYVAASSDGSFPPSVGAFDPTPNGSYDAVVFKLSPTGTTLVYSTFLGGSFSDSARAIAIDGSGAAFVTGDTNDSTTADFPTTPDAFDATQNGDYDAFLASLNPAGTSLVYSTFLGGSLEDFGRGVAVDGRGGVHVTGLTEDAPVDFPTTPGAFDPSHNGNEDAFVVRFFDPTATGGAGAAGSCAGRPATRTGTAGRDVIVGTPGADVIAGLGGNDTLKGLGGNDLLCGGEGNDKVNGGSGRDKLRGDAGNDKLKGGGGSDRLKGGPGSDTCAGGGGRDRAGCERERTVP